MRQASYCITVVATVLLLGILNYGCAKHKELQSGIVLDSGMDKKGAAGYAVPPSTEEMLAQSSGNYDSQYRSSDGHAAPAADSSGDGKPSPKAPGKLSGDTLERIGTWFNPVVYAQDTQIDEKYLIRTGDISVELEDFSKGVEAVYDIADTYRGIVTDSDLRNEGDNVRSGWITLRVPNTQFFGAFKALGALGEVTNQTIGSEDVSRQYVAAVSRLRNLTIEQDTLRKMLDEALAVQRARGLGEGYKILLDTQQRLSEVTGQIQSTEDELSQLADKITRSTIKVNLVQATKYESEQFSWGMGATFEQSKKELLGVVRSIGQGLIRFGTVGWLYLLPWLLIGFVLYRLIRRYGAKLLADKPTEKLS